jgi:hypothetical protein
MNEHPSGSLRLAELDLMIDRAEAIHDRYRQAAQEEGLTRSRATKRRVALQTIRGLLDRLQEQRAAAERTCRTRTG